MRCGIPPRLLKRQYSAREAAELAHYNQRYPIDDESNVWIPHGLLMAKISAFMGVKDGTAKDYMPFANQVEEPAPAPQEEPRQYSRKQLKRIMKVI